MAIRRWLGTVSDSWNVADNWSGGAVPVADDTVIIPGNAARNIYTGLDQSSVTISAFTIEEGCAINIGTTGNPLQLGCAAASSIWTLAGSGTYVIKVDGNANAYATIRGTGTYRLPGLGADGFSEIHITNASATVYVGWGTSGHDVDYIYNLAGATVYVGKDCSNHAGIDGPKIVVGAGVTVLECDAEELTVRGGTVTMNPTQGINGNIGTAYVYAGRLNYNGNETITDLFIYTNGIVDLSASPGLDAAITAIDIYGKGTFFDPNNANPVGSTIDLNGTSLKTASVHWGQYRKITTGAVA